MWNLPGLGIEPVSPALAGRFLSTEPPGMCPELLWKETFSPVTYYLSSPPNLGHRNWLSESAARAVCPQSARSRKLASSMSTCMQAGRLVFPWPSWVLPLTLLLSLLLIHSWSCSELDLNEIRLIVSQDCDRRGRQVLFDSKAVHTTEEVAAQVGNVGLLPLLHLCFNHLWSVQGLLAGLSHTALLVIQKKQGPRFLDHPSWILINTHRWDH